MYQEDFILRHIRLFVQAIARVLGLIKEGDLGLALETIRVSFTDYLGMGLDDFLAYPDERLTDFLYFGEPGPMGLNRTAFAAALLLQAGKIYAAREDAPRAHACFEKSLRLLLETQVGGEEPQELPDFAPEIEEVVGQVPLEALKPETLGPLSFYLDSTGDLRGAHEAVQSLLGRAPNDPDTQDLARSFYEYLLDEGAEKLAEGGLTAEQIRSALQSL